MDELSRTAGATVVPGAEHSAAGAPSPRRRRWLWWAGGVGVVAVAVVLAGTFVRLPYFAIAPGDGLDVNTIVQVDGAEVHPPEGELLLLFVRQRARVNLWEWVQARLDGDVDLRREEEISPDRSPEELRVVNEFRMEASQILARRVALERLGYEVPFADRGLAVLAVLPDRPAGEVLRRGDVILTANGEPIVEARDLSDLVVGLDPGDEVDIEYERAGERRSVTVGTVADPDDGRTVIGVFIARRYDFPVDIDLDTGSIGGPSAGLAMALSILDTLTPGELTGGERVAVTGEILDDGGVGVVGGVAQKAVTARRAGAVLFLVPACPTPAALVEEGADPERAADSVEACESDLVRARSRSGEMDLVAVADLDGALDALAAIGGDPLPGAVPDAA